MNFVFVLERPARKGGGDRYSTSHDKQEWSIYVPQSISRKNGKPAEALYVTISTVKDEI